MRVRCCMSQLGQDMQYRLRRLDLLRRGGDRERGRRLAMLWIWELCDVRHLWRAELWNSLRDQPELRRSRMLPEHSVHIRRNQSPLPVTTPRVPDRSCCPCRSPRGLRAAA
jgi:hypothetical protein